MVRRVRVGLRRACGGLTPACGGMRFTRVGLRLPRGGLRLCGTAPLRRNAKRVLRSPHSAVSTTSAGYVEMNKSLVAKELQRTLCSPLRDTGVGSKPLRASVCPLAVTIGVVVHRQGYG